jgi:hypothetical protein
VEHFLRTCKQWNTVTSYTDRQRQPYSSQATPRTYVSRRHRHIFLSLSLSLSSIHMYHLRKRIISLSRSVTIAVMRKHIISLFWSVIILTVICQN